MVLAQDLPQTGRVKRGARIEWRVGDSIALDKLPQARQGGSGIGDSPQTQSGECLDEGPSAEVWERKIKEAWRNGEGWRSLYCVKAASRPTRDAIPDGAAPNPNGPAPHRKPQSATLSPGRRLLNIRKSI